VVEVSPRKARKADKKAITEKSSMALLHREHHGPRQTLSEAINAHAFSQTNSRIQREKTSGSNASCSATSPRAAEKPRMIPVIWDNPKARQEGCAYNNPPQAHFSQDFDTHRGFESFYGDQRYENTSVPYGNHPSRSFMSNLGIMASSQRQLGSLQDVVRQEVVRQVSSRF
jgi:hypothetical protein